MHIASCRCALKTSIFFSSRRRSHSFSYSLQSVLIIQRIFVDVFGTKHFKERSLNNESQSSLKDIKIILNKKATYNEDVQFVLFVSVDQMQMPFHYNLNYEAVRMWRKYFNLRILNFFLCVEIKSYTIGKGNIWILYSFNNSLSLLPTNICFK